MQTHKNPTGWPGALPPRHSESDLTPQAGLDLVEDELVEERGGLHSEQLIITDIIIAIITVTIIVLIIVLTVTIVIVVVDNSVLVIVTNIINLIVTDSMPSCMSSHDCRSTGAPLCSWPIEQPPYPLSLVRATTMMKAIQHTIPVVPQPTSSTPC